MSDLRGDRPVRVSGAFDIDMSKVVEEAARRAAEAVVNAVAPAMASSQEAILQAVMAALATINRNVETATGLMFPAGLMSDADARATLTSMLPSGTPMAPEVAAFQHERLTEAGYAVVPVAGAALEHAIKVAQHRQRLAEQERRADARLAEETLAGVNGDWHEPHE